jgi:hypothetical protein
VDAVTSEKVCKECGHNQIYGGEEGMNSAVLTFILKMEAANSFEAVVSTVEIITVSQPEPC